MSNSDSPIFAAESSSLGWKPGYRPRTFMLYGAEFSLVQTKKDADGDVQMWIYFSHSLQKFAKIFND
jgi:hypothetical protein